MSAQSFEGFFRRPGADDAFERIFAATANAAKRSSPFDELRKNQPPSGQIPPYSGRTSYFAPKRDTPRQNPYEAQEKKNKKSTREHGLSDAVIEKLDDNELVKRVLACKTAHELFGLPRQSFTTKPLASKRFRVLARRLHPDKNRHDDATKAFQHLESLNKELLDLFVH